MPAFHIQGREFTAPLDPRDGNGFTVKSVPRPYKVEFHSSAEPGATLASQAGTAKHALIMADRHVASLHMKDEAIGALPTFLLDAREEEKQLSSVLRLIEFLAANRATRSSMLFVAGGGIVQDVAAFAACMYKRGMPWTFLPTTLLAQGDSGIGSKAALNYSSTKNLLGLFSAPRKVVMEIGFLRTLKETELLSGLGEIFRLHLTGGREFLAAFERRVAAARERSEPALMELLAGALAVKRAVIEVDEYEVDLRRSLNYGHSFGHALEAMVDYRIPHGIAVTIGMLVENEIAARKGILSAQERDAVAALGRGLVPLACRAELASLRLDGLLDLLRSDKKTEGNALKLVVPEAIGRIRFIDLELDQQAAGLVQDSLRSVVDAL